MTLPVLAVTSGEPAGIGPDICLDLAFADLPCCCIVLGDKNLLQSRAEQLGKTITLQDFDPQGGKPERGKAFQTTSSTAWLLRRCTKASSTTDTLAIISSAATPSTSPKKAKPNKSS